MEHQKVSNPELASPPCIVASQGNHSFQAIKYSSLLCCIKSQRELGCQFGEHKFCVVSVTDLLGHFRSQTAAAYLENNQVDRANVGGRRAWLYG